MDGGTLEHHSGSSEDDEVSLSRMQYLAYALNWWYTKGVSVTAVNDIA